MACYYRGFETVWLKSDVERRHGFVTGEKTQLKIPSRIDMIDRVASLANEIATRCGFDAEAIFGIELAVREAVINAVVHGNREDESKIVEVAFTDAVNALMITVRDFGAGFDPESIPDPTREENLLKPSGRGMFFMRTFMDEVTWQHHPEGGMIVRMTKRRS